MVVFIFRKGVLTKVNLSDSLQSIIKILVSDRLTLETSDPYSVFVEMLVNNICWEVKGRKVDDR